MDFRDCLLLLLSISVFLLFSFFCFYTFLVVGSVRQIKLTYVGFRAHVKIASRIVSCVNYLVLLLWHNLSTYHNLFFNLTNLGNTGVSQ